MGPRRRLSDGRAQLCRTAPHACEIDRSRHQASQDQELIARSEIKRRGVPNASPFLCPQLWPNDVRMHRQIDIEQLCADKGLRITEQRKTIARVLGDSEDHPDVETLHSRAAA